MLILKFLNKNSYFFKSSVHKIHISVVLVYTDFENVEFHCSMCSLPQVNFNITNMRYRIKDFPKRFFNVTNYLNILKILNLKVILCLLTC